MGVIKTNISKVYAKARDRSNTHVYRKGTRSVLNIPMRTVHFHSGDTGLLKNETRLRIFSKSSVQVPEKVYEVFRLAVLKKIENVYPGSTKEDYCVMFNKYPHQLLRFHAIASGARADRISEGMSNSFGTNFMKAAKIKVGDVFFQVFLSSRFEKRINSLKPELKKCCAKLPFNTFIL